MIRKHHDLSLRTLLISCLVTNECHLQMWIHLSSNMNHFWMGQFQKTEESLKVLIEIIAILIHFWLFSLPEMKTLNGFGLFIKLLSLSHMDRANLRGVLMLIKRSWLKIFRKSLSKVNILYITTYFTLHVNKNKIK